MHVASQPATTWALATGVTFTWCLAQQRRGKRRCSFADAVTTTSDDQPGVVMPGCKRSRVLQPGALPGQGGKLHRYSALPSNCIAQASTRERTVSFDWSLDSTLMRSGSAAARRK